MTNRHKLRLILVTVLLATGSGVARGQQGPPDYFMACDPDSMAYIYDNWWLDHYVPCTLSIGGQFYPDCRVRIRGDSSRNLPKKSLKVKTDGELFPNGNDVINFNADWYDPSYMRVVLAARLFNEAGLPAFDAEHGRLHLNGEFWGLYVLVQNMDEVFLAGNGLDPMGNLYKATHDGASLTVQEDIYAKWEKKSNELDPWDDLQALIDSLAAVPDERFGSWAAEELDTGELATMLAFNALLANGSTYYHNYYMYHDINGTGLWSMFPWDLDKTFAQYGDSYPYHRSSTTWLRDNPLVERFFITESTFALFETRVDELIATVFNPDFLHPIMDSLQVALEPSVAADLTDDIPDLDSWYWVINNEKQVGIAGRIADLQDQLATGPRNFRADPTSSYSYQDSIPLSWHAAADPNGDPVSYTLRYASSYDFPEGSTTVIEGIADTTITLRQAPPEGNYYWGIFATDGDPLREIQATDSYMRFRVDTGSQLPALIDEDTTLNYGGSPYFAEQDVTVPPGVTLTLQMGTEVRLAPGVKILVQGVMLAEGSPSMPVRFMADIFQQEAWGAVCFLEASGPSTLEHVQISDASVGGDYLWQKAAVSSYRSDLDISFTTFDRCQQCVYVQEADLQLRDSEFLAGNALENINVKDGSATLERCRFWNAGADGDAVDFDGVDPAVIRDCVFQGFPGSDDLVDLGERSLNVLMEDNVLDGAPDKGISVGEKTEAVLRRNAISRCGIGVAVKDSSICELDGNTFYANVTGLSVYQKIYGAGGGFAEAYNGIFSQSTSAAVSTDAYGELTLRYSISDTDTLPGENNLWGDPLLRDPEAGDFHLVWGSPCIDAGDPDSPEDPDLTPADLGAFFFDQGPLSLVINEINYHSAVDFDPEDWVELHNPLDVPVLAGGLKFKDVGHEFVIPEGTLIGSHGYLVLAENLAAFQARFPNVPNAIGDLDFGFSGAGEMLLLTGADGTIYDWVNYSDQPPWPPEPDGQGPTLELIDPLSDNSLPASWTASMGHGTPGAINSATDPTAAETAPSATALARPHPNPFNPRCIVNFSLAERQRLRLSVHDLRGRLLRVLAEGVLGPGLHQRVWDGRDDAGRAQASGVYFLRLQAGGRCHSQKLVLLR